MNRKKLILACSASFLVFIALALASGWIIYSKFILPLTSFRIETPTELRDPRIVIGTDLLERTQFLKVGAEPGKGIGSISDLLVKRSRKGSSLEVVVAGNRGALMSIKTE